MITLNKQSGPLTLTQARKQASDFRGRGFKNIKIRPFNTSIKEFKKLKVVEFSLPKKKK